MKTPVTPGTYIVAVSGGVDSVVLLDLLAREPGLSLVVAHFDHGIRADSAEDCSFVEALAAKYSLPFASAKGSLGADASEATARTARYAFLERVRVEQGADAIITAHHQDDLLETAIINMTRGTGRRGLSSLKSTPGLQRPLLAYSKKEITDYAETHGLQWREDSTNTDTKYLRNYIRLTVLPRCTSEQRSQLLRYITQASPLNDAADELVAELLAANQGDSLDRAWFVALPDEVAREVLAGWLRARNVGYDRQTLVRACEAIRVQRPGSSVPLKGNYYAQIGRDSVVLSEYRR